MIGAGSLNFGKALGTPGSFTDNAGASVGFSTVADWTPNVPGAAPQVVVQAGTQRFLLTGGRVIHMVGPTRGYGVPRTLPNYDKGGDAPDLRTAIPHAVPAVGWRNGWMNRAANVAIPFQFVPGPQGMVFRESPQPAPPSSNGQIWTSSGQADAPENALVPQTLINLTVPIHSRLRLSTFTFYLNPSSSFEMNYVWRILVGGVDIINPFTAGLPGRPTRSNDPVQISPQVKDLPVYGPGTPIVVQVQALSSLANTDTVAVSLGGTLWGDL